MLKTLANNVSLVGTATQTAQTTKVTPMLSGRQALVMVDLTTATGTPTVLVETSTDDGATYSTAATANVIGKVAWFEVALGTHIRTRQSAAGTAGTYNAYAYLP